MKEKYLIGVDLGTSATKAALYPSDSTLVAEASVEAPLDYPQPGVVELDYTFIHFSALSDDQPRSHYWPQQQTFSPSFAHLPLQSGFTN